MKVSAKRKILKFMPEDDIDCFVLGAISRILPSKSTFSTGTGEPRIVDSLEIAAKDILIYLVDI